MREIEDTRITLKCVHCENLFAVDIGTLKEGLREVECTHCHYKQTVNIKIQVIKRAIATERQEVR